MLENPRRLKLVMLGLSLYLEIGEGSGAKKFTGRRWILDVPCVNVSACDLSPILIYSKSPKMTSFSLLGFSSMEP